MCTWHLPLVKSLLTRIVLQTTVVNQELHSLEEGGRDRGRLLSEQDVDGLGRRDAQLRAATGAVRAALGIGAVHETVCARMSIFYHLATV